MNIEVVIVEDDIDESLFLKQAFLDSNYDKVSSFNDAISFIEYLNRPDTSLPKVAILDYEMPKISGFQLLAYLKRNEKFSEIEVILYSGYDGPDYKITCMKAGAVDYIRKFSSVEEMREFALSVKEFAETGVYKQ